MALTQEQRKKITANMKTLEGDGFIQRIKRVVTNSRDFYLIVGLGGTGSNALAEVKRELNNMVDGPSLSKYVRFLTIDTARADIEKLVRETLIEEDETCVLPHDGALSKVMNPTPFMAKWLNPQLKDHTAGGLEGVGAGNRRQCGRVLLCSDAAITLLQSKVNTAFTQLIANNAGAKCNLIILAGIAGGTGSGTVIDATYIISQILDSYNNGRHFNASYGFIFLPSASSDEVRASTDKGLATGNSNGYAALKEIEYHMTLSSRNEKFIMDYENFHVNQDDLFKHCFLIDGHGGAVLNAEPKTVAARTAADCIVNIIAAEQSQEGVGAAAGGAGAQTGSLLTALSNVTANLEDFIRNNEPQFVPRDSYYKFIATGYSECLIPTDLLTLYAAKKVFDHMYKLYQKSALADKEEAIRVLGELGLNSAEALLKRIDSKVHVGAFANKAQTSAAVYDAEEELQNELEKAFTDKMNDLFKKKGPYYLINLTLEIGNVLNARSTRPANASGKKGYEQEAIGRIFSYLAKISSETNRTTWEVYCAVIDELKRVLEGSDTVFTDTVIETDSEVRRYKWTPIRTRDSAGLIWLDEIMDEERIKKIIKSFEQALLDQRKTWTEYSDEREVNAATFVRNFVETGFTDILQLNLQDFVAKCYSGNSKAVALKDDGETATDELIQAAALIASTLFNYGDILAQIRHQARFAAAPKKYVLILPKDTVVLNKLIKEQMRTHLGHCDLDIYLSSHSQSFTLFSSHFAFPLEEFTWVENGERAYAACSGDDVVGRHMYESKINWRSLPNLINQDHWNEIELGYTFKEEKILSDYVSQMLDIAKEYGLVTEYDNEHSQFFLRVLDDAEGSTELSKAIVPFVVSSGAVAQDSRALPVYKEEASRLFGLLDNNAEHTLADLVSNLPTNTFVKMHTRPHTMPMQDGQEPRKDYQWLYTKKFLRKMYKTCISLQRTLGVMSALRELVSANNVRIQEQRTGNTRIQDFANYYGCGLIKYNNEEKSWVYQDDLGNESELLSEFELLPWQKPYHYYYMQEKFLALPDELFSYWADQYKEFVADKTKRSIITERQAELLVTLQTVVKEIAPVAFERRIKDAQSDPTLSQTLRTFYNCAVSQFGG